MSHKENWLEKQFDFDFPASKYVEFLQFLRETPEKLEGLVKSLSNEVLIRWDEDSWLIQENAGHFLFYVRLGSMTIPRTRLISTKKTSNGFLTNSATKEASTLTAWKR